MANVFQFHSVSPTVWRSLRDGGLVALAASLLVARPGVFSTVFFICAVAWAYHEHGSLRRQFFSSWVVGSGALFAGLVLFRELSSTVPVVTASSVGLITLFIVARVFFQKRIAVYSAGNAAFLIATFSIGSGAALWWVTALVFIATYLLFKEAFMFFGGAGERRVRLASLAIAFVSCGILTAFSFLPVGATGAAVVTTLLGILFRDGVSAHFQGFLTRSFVLRGTLLFAFVLTIIFASAPWAIR